MNRKFQSMLKQQWTNRLLGLFMCASLLLSSVAARPLAQSYDEAPPTPTSAPVVDTATPEPASPTQATATPTEVAPTPTEEQASPTAEPPVPTDEPATPTVEPVIPTPTEAAPTQAPTAPVVPAKPAQAVNPKVVSGVNFHQLVIKFKNGYASSLTSQGMSAQSSPGIAPLFDLLNGAELKPFFSSLKQTVGAQSTTKAGQAESVLSRYFVAQLPESTDFTAAQQTLDAITALPFIDTAYMEPIYKPAITPTEYFTDQQGYLDIQDGTAAHNGIEASSYAWDLTGGRGLGVKVYDIEQGWQIGHEDLPVTKSFLLDSANTSQQDWVDHGTAVLGVIGAVNNPDPINDMGGVTGIASDAELWMVSNIQDAGLTPRSLADAINLVVTSGTAGDIIVLPLEALGPVSEETPNLGCPDADSTSFEDIPVEYWQANFDAISAATEAGFVVVEAAGNGQMNLSDDRYGDRFSLDSRDSGAILVAAGTSGKTDDPRLPVCSTNYGGRVDLQGWGEDVVTTGYGDLFDGSPAVDPKRFYTATFGGTSAATAMVAGAVASFQGVAKDRGYDLTPDEVRDALHSTGTAQGTSAKHIGPLPDLKLAISKKIPETVTLLSPPNSGTPINTLRPTLDWDSFYNATQYELQVSKSGGLSNIILDITTTSSIYTFTSDLSSGASYYWRVRPMVDSVWQKYSDPWWLFRPIAVAVPGTSLVSPSDGTVFNHPADPPDFVWNKTTSVSGYEIQISTASDFSAGPGIFSDPVNLADTKTHTFSGPTLAPNTKYYWRVRCVIAGPPVNYSAWTSARVLYTSLDVVGPLLLPTDGTAVDSLRPYFEWTPVDTAHSYFLQISTYDQQPPDFGKAFPSSSVVFSVTINIGSGDAIPDAFYQMKSDLPRNRTLYWHVRDLGKYGSSAYSDPFSITTGNPPGVPAPSLPGIGAVVSVGSKSVPEDVVMKWSNPTNAIHYWLQISTTSDFADFTPPNIPSADEFEDKDVTNPYNATLTPNTKYYWRVRAGDAAPIWSNWSSTRIFYTAPFVPENLSVANNDKSLTPDFSWDIIPEAGSYRIQILKYSNLTSTCSTTVVLDKTITSSPPYTLTSALPRYSDTTIPHLCWRVRSIGLFGSSDWATDDTGFLTIDPPYAPSLLSPGNGVSLATFAPLLDWGSSPNQNTPSRIANEYQVQVSKSSSFSTTVIDKIVPIATGTYYLVGPDELVDAGTYYWHVRAHNTTDDTYSTWSSTWSFLTPPQFEGTIYNAMTVVPGPPDALPLVNLQISGTQWSTMTDVNGHYSFRGLPPGTYDLLISKGGYMRQTRKVSFSRGNNITQDFDIVPIWNPGDASLPIPIPPDPPDQKIRIQLTWGGSVADMDSNLWLPKVSPCLINKNNLDLTGCTIDPSITTQAEMIADDNQIYGTEVITIGALSPTTDSDQYIFAVLLNAAASKMAGSGAQVTIYDGTDFKGTFNVPASSSGIWWKVFTIKVNFSSITVTAVNSVGSKGPSPY